MLTKGNVQQQHFITHCRDFALHIAENFIWFYSLTQLQYMLPHHVALRVNIVSSIVLQGNQLWCFSSILSSFEYIVVEVKIKQ